MRRPQNLCDTGLLTWIMNNELEYEPDDYEKDCWIAHPRKCTNKDGRPQYSYKGRVGLMYRQTWEMWNDDTFPKGLVARHICDNPRCINPLHIEPGTAQENEADKKVVVFKKTKLAITPSDLSEEEKVDFWLENHTEAVGDCLIFLGGTGSDGYGRRNVMIDGVKKNIEVHRWVYCVKNNEDYFDKSYVARHTCHNRSCINPDHITLGTRKQNTIDSRHYSKAAKLSEQQVREIIENFLKVEDWPRGSKRSFCDTWANKFGVTSHSINNLVFSKRRWVDILKEYDLL